MKKRIIAGAVCGLAIAAVTGAIIIKGGEKTASAEKIETPAPAASSAPAAYKAPEFYRGLYLTNPSGKKVENLKKFIANAKRSNLNVMVVDAQPAPNGKTNIPKENVQLMLDNGIHPVARVVCFDQGLKRFPIEEEILANRISVAKSAAELGFKEIQFDYVRFNDDGFCAKIPVQTKYEFIENFLARAKKELAPYNVKIAADVFGRIPLNSGDPIGQRMSGLDKVVDVICPMAYPSHYTWSEKMMADPYYTVHLTSARAKERVKQAQIVSYIQAFKMKVKKSGLEYDEYVRQQIKAVHDAQIAGYIFWNAAQEYTVPFKVAEDYYSRKGPAQAKAASSKTVTM